MSIIAIEEVHAINDTILSELSELLIAVVEDGASIGFLPPITELEAKQYWEGVLAPDVLLFVARMNGRIAGTVQLHLCMKPNGMHRAEIAKLMAHPDCRRNGIGRQLMLHAEEQAKQAGRSLLVLDTREGDPSNLLYTSIGYTLAGRIPSFARSAGGELDATMLYYKLI
ncbi:acetyltransferase (GNAT) family protein [Paenibacillus taihuensis]|uniref:Acetyltransferase (GNAT) family protein n=1 Tax=Paenibacillus taihuensis TaxID=1156355 RepID=A0A3D9RNN4_9BACL|nr:GNAT family N-acetyltransferase [Paenibacillus taihuensis]REE81520.1 acetyltransferase (GNAT) family protein [Paenibacillus taihuensis]